MAFTSVAVDAQVTATDGSAYDVLFVGTSNGRLLKAVNSVSYKSRKDPRTVIIEELEVGEGHVTGLNIVKTGKSTLMRVASVRLENNSCSELFAETSSQTARK